MKASLTAPKSACSILSSPLSIGCSWPEKKLPEAERTRFSKALEALKEGRDDQILKIIRARQFVPANDQEYGAIRQIARELNLLN